jgi:hypothetical protein
MKSIIRITSYFLFTLASVPLARAQTSSAPAASEKAATSAASSADKSAVAGATNASRTDVYHVHFTHAVPGKAAELGESLKTPGPNAPMPGHMIILRHQAGDAWDYAVISHYGTKFTVEAAREQQPNAKRDLSDWHNDTLVNGPSWSEFTRALGIGDDAKKTSGSVYVVSTYRVNPGHRDEAEKNLGEPPNPAIDKTAGTVLMQHLEGSPWQYLTVARYNSWQDLAATEVNIVPVTAKKDSPWSKFREHIVYHTDTLCDRTSP